MLRSGEKMLPCPPRPLMMDRRWKPNVELAPNCPRCHSSNTKFCYYNNYSLTQPRYFCKGCRRYWTKGGSLRNVPVGGGCRKNRRGKSVRISNDRIGAGDSSYGRTMQNSDRSDLTGDNPLGSLCHMKENSLQSTDTSRSDDVSTIDLALVYAKFLNQRPHFEPESLGAPELPGELDSSFDLSSSSELNHTSPIRFPQEPDIVREAQMSEGDHIFVGSGFDSNHKQQERIAQFMGSESSEFGLHELPAEGIGQDTFWSNCSVVPNFTWQTPQPQGFESVLEEHLNPLNSNLLNGNWSSFDLPSYDAAGFTRP